MEMRWTTPGVQRRIDAGLLGSLAGGILCMAHAFAQTTVEPGHAYFHASLLRAGSAAAEVKCALGEPTAATELGPPGSGDMALVYANEPLRTKVVLTADRVTSIALDVVYIDPLPLPMRARVIKAMMVHAGVAPLLGAPTEDERLTEAGRYFERMTYATAGEPEFSVFLIDGLVVDVRLGHDRPAGLGSLMLPVASAGSGLAIGQSPAQADLFLGPVETTIRFALEGQPVEYATYHERQGDGHVTVTFIGGLVTAFTVWPPDAL
jgi:hypothetical protein